MFRSSKPAIPASVDFTGALREASFYRHGQLRNLGLGGEVTALAVDPVLSLLAVGTSAGAIHVYGSPAFQFVLPITPPGVRASVDRSGRAPGAGVRFLAFHPGHNRLLAIDDGSTLHSFALSAMSDSPTPNLSPPLPVREAMATLPGEITAVEQPAPSYTHMLLTTREGMTLAWDLRQGKLSNFIVPNLWAAHEERLVRSGVPDRQRTLGGPQATCTAMNPRDLNIMLIGYEGGVVAYDFRQADAVRTFELTLPPGAPGGGSYHDDALWAERRPSVTSIVWRPDGLVFAVGHADGCIAFWAYADPDKPFLVRTLTHEDVHVPDAEALMESGALGGDETPSSLSEGQGTGKVLSSKIPTASSANREPIYKLSWASFPDSASLKTLAAAGAEEGGLPLTNATADYAERGETLLLVLGGQSPGEKPGINMLQFPAYVAPPPSAAAKKAQLLHEGLTPGERQAFRSSLEPTGTSNYPTKTPPEDFTLLPRSSPYFGGAHDAVAIFVLLTPDPALPPAGAPRAERELEAYVFPPARSDDPPPVKGRRSYIGAGGLTSTPATPTKRDSASVAERLQSAVSDGKGETRKGPERKQSDSSWRFPWTGSPRLSLSNINLSGTPSLRVPAQMWSGGLSVLGTRLLSIPSDTFMRLIAPSLEESSASARVPLRGGIAVPDLQSHGAPDLNVTKTESYRVLVTWHADASVRFWDISPHILVLPTPLHFEYPAPLDHLTINVTDYLRHPDTTRLPLAKLWEQERGSVQIQDVELARKSLECVVTMKSGEVIVAKFAEATQGDQTPPSPSHDPISSTHLSPEPKAPSLPTSPESTPSPRLPSSPSSPKLPSPLTAATTSFHALRVDESEEDATTQPSCDLTEIGHLPKRATDGFDPVAILTAQNGAVVATAVSDVGFIAVAFERGLVIMDMRGPRVILCEDSPGNDVETMMWSISSLGGDTSLHPRLFVSHASGTTRAYTLNAASGAWAVAHEPACLDTSPSPVATFLLHPESGDELRASPEGLSALASSTAKEGKWEKHVPTHSLFVVAGKRTLTVTANVNGDRIAEVDFNEDLISAHYVTRHGHRVLVAITRSGSALLYTVPHLEFVTRLDLFFGGPRSVGSLSFDDQSGDFVEYAGPLDMTLRTLFNFRKPFPPRLDPIVSELFTPPKLPAQPTAITSSSFGWMWRAGPLTGAQLDAIITPNRGAAPKPLPAPRRPLMSWGDPIASTVVQKSKGPAKGQAAEPKRTGGGDAYSQIRDGLNKRGEALEGLGEQIESIANAASSYAEEARKLAARESAKVAGKGLFKW